MVVNALSTIAGPSRSSPSLMPFSGSTAASTRPYPLKYARREVPPPRTSGERISIWPWDLCRRQRAVAHKTQVGRNTSDNRVQLKESTIRRRAKVRGLKLEKERNNPTKSVYRLFDPLKNKIVFGGSRKTYWATLEQCAKYIHPEIPMPGQMFNPEQLKSRTKLVLKRFGHLEKLSVRENPADLRRHGTKHDRVRAVLCN